jgi:hypothetical protein
MVARGEKGDTGRVGDQGRVGDPGATGDTGPAGESGPVGEHGEVGPKGISGNVAADRRLAVVMVWSVVAYLFLAGLVLWNQHRITDGAKDIRRVVYEQCVDRNTTTARQNGLIDKSIEAERRRTKPSPQTIRDLTDFKGTISDCGPKP